MKKILFLVLIFISYAIFAKRSGHINNYGHYSIKCPACIQRTEELKNISNNTFFCNGCYADRRYFLEKGEYSHSAIYNCAHNHLIAVDLKTGDWNEIK